jgi:hypothetical protein
MKLSPFPSDRDPISALRQHSAGRWPELFRAAIFKPSEGCAFAVKADAARLIASRKLHSTICLKAPMQLEVTIPQEPDSSITKEQRIFTI